jgi:putative transposase
VFPLEYIKIAMNMKILKCETPEMIEKEIWMFVTAYNLVRTVIAQAALKYKLQPRQLSFTGALNTLESYRSQIFIHGNIKAKDYSMMLRTISNYIVGNRPNRIEPRVIKRRWAKKKLMTKPRKAYKRRLSGADSRS